MLKIENVLFSRKDFKLEVDILLEKGKINTLLGPSGCGKTTLLRLISGLETPDSGRILWNEQDITSIIPEKRNFGFVFQNFALFPHMTVEENIRFGMKKYSNFNISEKLEEMKLAGFESRMPETLSGGEKQRVALIRALASDPEIILMDEPLSSLDASLRLSLRKMIKQVQRETGITMIYVTHDQEEALWLSDKIIMIDQGDIIETGNPEKLYYKPEKLFTANFLGDAILLPITGTKSNQIETPEGIFEVSQSGKYNTDNLYLFFRQRWMKPVDKKNPKNCISGNIKTLNFSGEYYHIDLESITGRIYSVFISYYDGKSLLIGDPLTLEIHKDICQIITD